MKPTLRFFSFLDMVSFILLCEQVFYILAGIKNITLFSSSKIHTILLLIIFPMLIASSFGLFNLKRWGLIVYYFQFPLRLVVWVFSFGFLTFISEYFSNQLVFDWLFRLAVILEFFRLYFSVYFHRRYFRGLQFPSSVNY